MDDLRTVLFWPGDEWRQACLDLAEALGLDVRSKVDSWSEAVHLVRADLLDILLIGSWRQLPPNRTPRVIAVEDYQPPTHPPEPGRPHWQ